MKKNLVFLFKLLLTMALIGSAFHSVDFSLLTKRIDDVRGEFLVLAAAVMAIQFIIVSLRWRIIAKLCNLTISVTKGAAYVLIGVFFNQCLPATIGGDAVRAWLAGRDSNDLKGAFYSVICDRLIGLIWLMIAVLLCLPWAFIYIGQAVSMNLLMFIGLLGLVGAAGAFSMAFIANRWQERWRLLRWIKSGIDVLFFILKPGPVSIYVTLLSLSINFMTALSAWFVVLAFNEPMPLFLSFILFLPVMLVAALPISIAGWGVREGAMVLAFELAGLSRESGLAVSVTLGIIVLIISLPGGVLWLVSERWGSLTRKSGLAELNSSAKTE